MGGRLPPPMTTHPSSSIHTVPPAYGKRPRDEPLGTKTEDKDGGDNPISSNRTLYIKSNLLYPNRPLTFPDFLVGMGAGRDNRDRGGGGDGGGRRGDSRDRDSRDRDMGGESPIHTLTHLPIHLQHNLFMLPNTSYHPSAPRHTRLAYQQEGWGVIIIIDRAQGGTEEDQSVLIS